MKPIRRHGLLLTAFAVAAGLPSAARADSIYPTEKSRSMFADRRASAVGDVITVQITENTTAVQSADTDLKRSNDSKAEGGSGLWGILRLAPRASVSGAVAQKGSGSTTRSSRLVSTITCRVVQKTATGQLMLKGERTLKINDDLQTIRFTGVARPEDVAPDNTVSSSLVADASIEVFGKGPVDRHVRPGLLSRIFEMLF